MRRLFDIRVRLISALCVFAVILAAVTVVGVKRYRNYIVGLQAQFFQHAGTHPLMSKNQLLGSYDPVYSCNLAVYEDSGTILYTNRPYHTDTSLKVLNGLNFCLMGRHSETYSLIRVDAATTLYAIGVDEMGLESLGWKALPDQVLVTADGLSFDRLYSKQVRVGRHLVNYAFQSSSVPVFWNPKQVQIIN